mmetsp:Transcript_70779/g.153706  ORF Transcript_70779/g.153706 Transcript_70779/m.153706 type:complete len:235 (+) Transcript_70779:110-814(+)
MRRGIDPFHHRLELPVWPAFVEIRATALDCLSHGFVPENRAHHLPSQQLDDLVHRGLRTDRLRSGVHVDLHFRSLHGWSGSAQGLEECCLRATHQRCVEGARGLEQLRLQGTGLGRPCREELHRSGIARHGEALGEEEIGYLAHLVALDALLTKLLQLFLAEPSHGEHSLARGAGLRRLLVHGLAPRFYESQAGLEVEDACSYQGCVLAQGEASHSPASFYLLRLVESELLQGS